MSTPLVPLCRCYPLRLVVMWPREVSHALEILRRAGYSSYLVTSRPSSPPHLFSNMDSPTRRHLGLPSCPAGREELREQGGAEEGATEDVFGHARLVKWSWFIFIPLHWRTEWA